MFRVAGDIEDAKKTPYEIAEEQAEVARAIAEQESEPMREEARQIKNDLMEAIRNFEDRRVDGIMQQYLLVKATNAYCEEDYNDGEFIDVAANTFYLYPEDPELPNEPKIVACRSIIRILLDHIFNSHLEQFIREWEDIAREIRPPFNRQLFSDLSDRAQLKYDRARMIVAYARYEMSERWFGFAQLLQSGPRIDANIFRQM